MKNLLIADVHLKDSNLNIYNSFFKQIVDECSRMDIHRLFLLGDIFEDRKKISVKTITNSIYIGSILSNVKEVYMIVGNHDSLYKNKIDPTSLDIFQKFENINIIKQVTCIDNITMVPWIWNKEEVIESNAEYIFGHFDFAGFKMNDNYISQKGIDSKDFSKFKRVFTGHFHTPSEKNNIKYLGSPIQHTFHDEGSPRGYYIFNNENDTIDFIEYKDSPMFITIDTSKDLNKYNIEGNIVRLKFDKDYGIKKNNEIIESIQSRNPIKLVMDTQKFIELEIEKQEDIEVEDIISNTEMLLKYIDIIDMKKYPATVDKKILVNIINELVDEMEK